MATKCDQCGVEASIEEAFFKQRRSFRRAVSTYCPNCSVKRQTSAWKWSLFNLVGMGLLGTLLVLYPRKPDFLLLNLFFFQIFMCLSIIPHEFGHAGMAQFLGLKVLRVYLGVGPVLGRRRWLGFEVEFRTFPQGGLVLAAPQTTRWLRAKHFAFILAGPGANIILAAAILPWLDPSHGWSMRALRGGIEFGWTFFYANALVVLVNLWPCSFMTSIGKLPSDGKQILMALFLSRKNRDALHAGGFTAECALAFERGDKNLALEAVDKGLSFYPDDELLLNWRGLIWMELGKYKEARAGFIDLLGRQSKLPFMRATMLNNVAYVNALLGGEDLLREADQFSVEAMEAMGWMAAMRGTRGTVLTMLGRYEEARPLLREAMNGADLAGNKASNACLIAILEARCQNREAAQEYLAEAKKLNRQCHLLQRAEAEVREGG